MNLLQIIILAILQGLTEFLPISSSGHLVIAEHLLGLQKDNITVEVALHLGTLLAILVAFRKELLALLGNFFKLNKFREIEEVRLFIFILIGTIPAVLVGLFARDSIQKAFSMPKLSSLMLLFTGIFLLLTKLTKYVKVKPLKWYSSIVIGIAQALAILPGISRSGWTIGTGRLLGIEPEKAYTFSFLLAIPAILGATILELFNLETGFFQASRIYIYLTGIIVSALVGYCALKLLKKIIIKKQFYIFGLYCILISIILLIVT